MGDVGDKLKGYTVIREGEAEILMHSSNAVFYNKTQVTKGGLFVLVGESSLLCFILFLFLLFAGLLRMPFVCY